MSRELHLCRRSGETHLFSIYFSYESIMRAALAALLVVRLFQVEVRALFDHDFLVGRQRPGDARLRPPPRFGIRCRPLGRRRRLDLRHAKVERSLTMAQGMRREWSRTM